MLSDFMEFTKFSHICRTHIDFHTVTHTFYYEQLNKNLIQKYSKGIINDKIQCMPHYLIIIRYYKRTRSIQLIVSNKKKNFSYTEIKNHWHKKTKSKSEELHRTHSCVLNGKLKIIYEIQF